jgi:hypothetical protein
MSRKTSIETGRRGYDGWGKSLVFIPIWLVGVALVSLIIGVTTYALTSISKSYITTDKASIATMVSLQKGSSERVDLASSGNAASLLGVVISADTSLITLSGDQENQVQVATGGLAQLLVSDMNGDIVTGDYITPSPIAGLGMKATSNVRVIGTAQSSLKDAGGSKQTYKGPDGKDQSTLVGQISVLINVSNYFIEPDKTIIPSAIQNIANGLAGRTVSSLPILISAGIFVVMLIIVMSIIYSMIRSSIISIGRNPLSQSAVYRDLIQLSGLVLIILSVGIVSIYLVLSRIA